jgi:hypothetical protein
MVQQAVGEQLGVRPEDIVLAEGFAYAREGAAGGGAGAPRASAYRAAGLRAHRGQVRDARRGRQLQHARARRRLPRRHDRRLAGLLLHRARRRVRGRPRDRRDLGARAWIAHDCGRAISPVQVEGQIEGSTYMGLAEALLEEHEVYTDPRYPDAGLHKRPSLLEYTIPTTSTRPRCRR